MHTERPQRDTATSWDREDARQRINLTWLIRLRWGAAIGQWLAVATAAWGLHVAVPLPPLLAVLLLTTASNALLLPWAARLGRVTEAHVGSLLGCDVLLLAVMLYFTGGCTNPFSFLYLIHIAVASLTLRPPWLWAVVGLVAACFGALFFVHVPLPIDGGVDHAGLPPALQRQGLAVAFTLAAAFIVHFVQRITAALAAKEAEVAAARELRARTERLTSLATLAAGAAHELSTPLATIAVVARELERALVPLGRAALSDDAGLIRQQVERCRSVLLQMAADAGTDAGEPLCRVSVGHLLEGALAHFSAAMRHRVIVAQPLPMAEIFVPLRGSSQALRAVIKNALEASGSGGAVQVAVQVRPEVVELTVRDQGHGMAAEVLAHVSEPFYTTKAPGLGMGLGLFLARTLLEDLGGALTLTSRPQAGTTATLRLPRGALAA